MDLSFTDDQLELERTALRFVTERVLTDRSPDDLRAPSGRDLRLWPELTELGWTALAIPEEAGGAGAAITDIAVLFEALGRGPVQAPLFEAAVLAPSVISVLRATDLLAEIIAGEMVMTATDLLTGRPTLHVNGSRISGQAMPVHDAADATHLLALTGAPPALAVIDLAHPSVARRHHRGMAQRQFTVVFDETPIHSWHVLDAESTNAVNAAVLRCLPILCAYQVGSMQAVVEMTIRYANERYAFGKPIASYQRVQDHIISAVNHLDSARWATYYALSLCEIEPCPAAAIHTAKALTADAHHDATTAAHEVHAGIGTDLRYPLAAHTMVARALYPYLGNPRWHRSCLAPLIGVI